MTIQWTTIIDDDDGLREYAAEIAGVQSTPTCPYYPGCTPDACTRCWEGGLCPTDEQ